MGTHSGQIIGVAVLCIALAFYLSPTMNMGPNLQMSSETISTAATKSIEDAFAEWVEKYNKRDLKEFPIEYRYRLQVFSNNYEKVRSHNAKADRGQEKYHLGLNQFAHMTEQQYKLLYSNIHADISRNIELNTAAQITLKCSGSIADAPNPPDAVNWNDKSIIEKTVINEGACAANWAISAVAAIQSLAALKLDKLVKYSEQQLIDCSEDYGNEGCGGGFMEQAYWYIIDAGLASDKAYPFVNKVQKCKYSPSMRSISIKGCASVPSQKYDKLLSAVIQQPVTVAVASQKFMLYEKGVYTGDCTNIVDRGMLLVGYGKDGDNPYWLLKNSLGPNWGEKGFIRLLRKEADGAGMCGIQLAASIPTNVS